MHKDDWLEISQQLRAIHPVMIKKVDSFEQTMVKATNAAKACEPEGIGVAIDACKQSVALCNDVEHLKAAGIMTEEKCSRLIDGIESYSISEFRKLFREYAACLGKETQTEILSRVLQLASELPPKWQQLLVQFAVEVREIERMGGQSQP